MIITLKSNFKIQTNQTQRFYKMQGYILTEKLAERHVLKFVKIKLLSEPNLTFLFYLSKQPQQKRMSLQIIIQEVKIFGNMIASKPIRQNQPIQEIRKFRMSLGDKTFTSNDYGFFISPDQLAFDQSFSFFYDNQSIVLYVEVFKDHETFDNSDLEQVLFAEFDLSDVSSPIGDRLQTTVFNFNYKAVGKLTMSIEVFKQGPRFTQKVTSKVLFQTVKQQKLRQIKVSSAGKNIKNLMVNNALTNSLMTINYFQVKPDKEDQQIFNRECFIMIRYGFNIKAHSKVVKVTVKQNVVWNEYIQFMKNDDVKFQFYFLFYNDLGNLVCKAKGQIKYIVFDETINNHSIVLFDKRSNIYGDVMVKFIQKQVEVVNIQNKLDKKLREEEGKILQAIDEFNKFKFQSKNNNRILSQKLRQLELRQLQQEEQKMKPLDDSDKKKKEEHSKFIEFLQKEVIKIERQLKKRQLQEKKDGKKHMYQANTLTAEKNRQKKFNNSLTSSQFRQNLQKIDEIQQSHIIAQNVDQQF